MELPSQIKAKTGKEETQKATNEKHNSLDFLFMFHICDPRMICKQLQQQLAILCLNN